MATQAQAQEATTSADHGADAVVDATHGETLGETHAGTEAHSEVFPPFDPSTFPSQLLWLAITFAALYFVLSRLALPRITRVLEDRKAIIDGDIAAADASRQKTDAAIAAYEAALASAKAKAQTIANQSRDDIHADIAAKRGAVEADLAGKLAEAEARIAATKSEALTHVDEIATETAQTVVVQLLGDVPPDSVRAAVAKVSKE
jgi:F-type H+-transporting ATPase subunit b